MHREPIVRQCSSLGAGVWRQGGRYVPAKQLMNPLSVCLNIDQI